MSADNYKAPDDSFASFDADEQKITNSGLMQNANGSENAAPAFNIENICVASHLQFPIELDICAEIQNILAAGMFRNLESQILYDKLCDMLLSDRYMNLVESLYWVIYVIKFQKDDAELLDKLRKRVGAHYSEYFSLLEKPKEELSNMGIFTAAYICHIMYFNLFPKSREVFDMRFILDCYHIIIHEVNGIFVSDFYIQTSIERFFGNKFFHFEKRAEKKKKVEKVDFKNEPLLRNLNYDLNHLPYVSGGLDLAHELSSKLRKGPKKFKPTTVTDLVMNDSSKVNTSKIMKLTQPNDEKSILSNGTEQGSYFPRLKFNCHQISPTVSSFLENSNNTLPFQKRKVINYSSNKHMSDPGLLNYQPSLDLGKDTKPEKKDKKKHQPKGNVNDYKLKNRADDYYLGYLAKDMKAKFRFELDMKYILDSVKPVLRGHTSVKCLTEESNKKFNYPTNIRSLSTQQPIREETEEEVRETREVRRTADRLSPEKDERNNQETSPDLDAPRKERKDDFIDLLADKKSKMFEETGNESTLPMIKSKIRGNTKDDVMSSKAPIRKGLTMAKDDKKQKGEDEDLQESNKIVMPDRLKFQHAANKKLGKGRFFVSLTDYDEDPDNDQQKRQRQKWEYDDRRKFYVAEHDKMIRKDTDANIENIVHNLMTKQSNFNKNFGKFSNSRSVPK